MDIIQSIVDAIFGYGRDINGIVPDVVVEEKHTDTMTVTDHPVEKGSFISDHAFKMPADLSMRIGWSPSASVLNGLFSGSIFSGVSSTKEMYALFLQMQSQAVLMNISTGKRAYTNMVIVSISEVTNEETENALFLDVVFREINIVETEETTLKAENQSDPQKTGPLVNSGDRSPKPVNQSALNALLGG